MKPVRIWWAVPLLALLFLILAPVVILPLPVLAIDYNRPQQALYHLTAQAADSGWTLADYVQAGDLWRSAGDVARAVPYWQAALQLDADNADLLWRLASAWLDLQSWSQVVPVLESLQETETYAYRASYHLGLIRAAFDPVQAADDLRAAARNPAFGPVAADMLNVLRTDPARADLPLRVGEALLRHELWAYAELAFRHAVDLNPADGTGAAYVGLARLRQGKDSRQWLAQALARTPDSGFVHYVDGLHRREADDMTGSLSAFIQAAALEPDNPAFFAELGTAYRLVGDMENAERWLRVAVTTSNGDPRFEELLALFYAEAGYNLDGGGLAVLEAAAEAQPDAPDLLAGYGWALYRLGDVEQAAAQLNAALELDSANPRALYYLAQIQLEQGEQSEAIALLERLVAVESAFRLEAQRTLNALRGE